MDGKKIRKWNRVIHRDLGYLAVGLTLIYAISGFVVNHVQDWNPNYEISHIKSNIGIIELSDKEKDRYMALIQAAVQEQWKVPANLGNAVDPLVEMRLTSNGQVESVSILESSGSAALDASLIRAIRAAAPFELPARQFEFFRVNRMRFHPLR